MSNSDKHLAAPSNGNLTAAGSPSVVLPALTARQEAFARGYSEGLSATDAYVSAFEQTSSRAAARVSAFRLLRVPKVAARIRDLQEQAAQRSTKSAETLIAELEQMVSADIGELVRLDVGSCEACWGAGADHSSEPNPDCASCHGAGKPRVMFSSSTDASPGARRLLKGIETWPDGTIKRLLFFNQAELRIELHRLRGLHVERSVNVNLNANLPKIEGMSPAELLDLLESVAPSPKDAEALEGEVIEAEPSDV